MRHARSICQRTRPAYLPHRSRPVLSHQTVLLDVIRGAAKKECHSCTWDGWAISPTTLLRFPQANFGSDAMQADAVVSQEPKSMGSMPLLRYDPSFPMRASS